MIKIWQEQITLLGVIDTGALLASPKAIAMRADGRFPCVPTDASLRCRSHKPFSKSAIERAQCQACLSIAEREQIMQYGLWQDYGTGRETPRKSSAEGELAHTSAEAQPGLRSRNPRGNSGDLGRAKTSRTSLSRVKLA